MDSWECRTCNARNLADDAHCWRCKLTPDFAFEGEERIEFLRAIRRADIDRSGDDLKATWWLWFVLLSFPCTFVVSPVVNEFIALPAIQEWGQSLYLCTRTRSGHRICGYPLLFAFALPFVIAFSMVLAELCTVWRAPDKVSRQRAEDWVMTSRPRQWLKRLYAWSLDKSYASWNERPVRSLGATTTRGNGLGNFNRSAPAETTPPLHPSPTEAGEPGTTTARPRRRPAR
jgi:hypothetical protein